jgi:hypothetical protein
VRPSTACCQVSVVTVPPFLVRTSQTPGDVAWLPDNHARSASASATINSSSPVLAMTARYRCAVAAASACWTARLLGLPARRSLGGPSG